MSGRVTDDERREVAKRLREITIYSGNALTENEKAREFVNGLITALGGVSYTPLAVRLADLIEPAPADDCTSDGYHTFGQLYYQRMVLWAAIVNANSARAWKTRRHEDGELCFGGGWFLVTIDTPEGAYGYHYEDTPANWGLFRCKELPRAKPWDGYDERDVCRILSLIDPEGGDVDE
nr:hypothetical protein [uncultured Olsenella sp.]